MSNNNNSSNISPQSPISNNNNNNSNNSANIKNKIKTIRKKIKNHRKVTKTFDVSLKRINNLSKCLFDLESILQSCDHSSNNNNNNNNSWNILYERFKLDVIANDGNDNKIENIDDIKRKFAGIDEKLNIICNIINVIIKYINKDTNMRKKHIEELTKMKVNTENFIKQLIYEFNNQVKFIEHELSKGMLSFQKENENSSQDNTNNSINKNNSLNNQLSDISDIISIIESSSYTPSSIGDNNNNNTNKQGNALNQTKSSDVNDQKKNENCKFIVNSLFQLYKYDEKTNINLVVKEKKRKNNDDNTKQTRKRKRNTKLT